MGTRELRFRKGCRAAETSRDLAVRQSFDIVKPDHDPRVIGQTRQGPLQIDPAPAAHFADRRLEIMTRVTVLDRIQGHRFDPTLFPQQGQCLRNRDSPLPGAKGPVSAKGPKAPDDFEEGFLDHLLGLGH